MKSSKRYVVKDYYADCWISHPWDTDCAAGCQYKAFIFSDLDEAKEQRDLFNACDSNNEYKVYRLVSRKGSRVPPKPKKRGGK